jgi:hypothetical protein
VNKGGVEQSVEYVVLFVETLSVLVFVTGQWWQHEGHPLAAGQVSQMADN